MGESSPRGYNLLDEAERTAAADVLGAQARDERLHALRHILVRDYSALVGRLTRRFRSHDRALEALHDTYLKLHAAPIVDELRNPTGYLYRMTLNLAANTRQREARMSPVAPSRLHGIADDAPGPERAALARVDLDKLLALLDALPERRRAIFLARWRDGLDHRAIAGLFAIHKRTVQKELTKAERCIHASVSPSTDR